MVLFGPSANPAVPSTRPRARSAGRRVDMDQAPQQGGDKRRTYRHRTSSTSRSGLPVPSHFRVPRKQTLLMVEFYTPLGLVAPHAVPQCVFISTMFLTPLSPCPRCVPGPWLYLHHEMEEYVLFTGLRALLSDTHTVGILK